MDGGTISGAAVSSVFTATLRISQIAYELKAVGEQTRDLLDSTNHIQITMQAVRTLRRQKSMHLEKTEKEWIDNVLANTEKTLSNVAMLIEPARVDMQTKFGSVGLLRRGMFVFRDSPKVATNLSRLGLASQSLNTVMNILCTRDGVVAATPIEKSPVSLAESAANSGNEKLRQPPTYDESEFLNRRRSHVKKAPIVAESPITRMTIIEEPEDPPSQQPPLDNPNNAIQHSPPTVFDDGLICIAPAVNITEVTPTPPTETPATRGGGNPFEGSDGLQVVGGGGDTFFSLTSAEPQMSCNWGSPPVPAPAPGPTRPASIASRFSYDDPSNQEWQFQHQHHQQQQRQSQYQYWHGDQPSPSPPLPLPRQSCASFTSLNSQFSGLMLSPEMGSTPEQGEAWGQPGSERPSPRLSQSTSAVDLRRMSGASSGSGSVVSWSEGTGQVGGLRPVGRSHRRAWLEFQSER